MTTRERDTSGFVRASHQSQALSLGTLGVSGLLWPIAMWGFPSPARFLAAWAAAFGGVWLLSRARRHWRLHEMELDLTDGDGFDASRSREALEVAHAGLPPEVLANAQYQRLRDIVENPDNAPGSQKKPWGVVVSARVEENQLVSYTIKTTKKGMLGDKKQFTERCNLLRNVIDKPEGSEWLIKTDPVEDHLEAELIRDSLPEAVAPEFGPPPSTVEEAIAAYPKLRWRFGVDPQGNEVGSLIAKLPHIAMVAETGGGKSVMARSLLETLRPYASCWIFDGKGADYPQKLIDYGNISWISKTPEEHIVGLRWLVDELMERNYVANKRKSSGQSAEAFNFPPIFVLIDELGSMRSNISVMDPKEGLALFDYYVNELLRLGRESRIHVCVSSQTVRVADIPGHWQENMKQIVFFGKVSGRSMLSDKIPEVLKPEILTLTSAIRDEQKGRGVVIAREDVRVRPVLFQGYWAMSPGTDTMSKAADFPEVQARWRDALPRLERSPNFYDRVGIEVDGPEWRDAGAAEIANTPTVVVADANGPIPGMEKYDPLSPEFLGASTPNRGRRRAKGRGSVGSDPLPSPGE